MKKSSIFRQDSMERISSVDRIDDYIKVTSTPVWLILLATVVVLIGLIVWSIFGQITVMTDEGMKHMAPISYIIDGDDALP